MCLGRHKLYGKNTNCGRVIDVDSRESRETVYDYVKTMESNEIELAAVAVLFLLWGRCRGGCGDGVIRRMKECGIFAHFTRNNDGTTLTNTPIPTSTNTPTPTIATAVTTATAIATTIGVDLVTLLGIFDNRPGGHTTPTTPTIATTTIITITIAAASTTIITGSQR